MLFFSKITLPSIRRSFFNTNFLWATLTVYDSNDITLVSWRTL